MSRRSAPSSRSRWLPGSGHGKICGRRARGGAAEVRHRLLLSGDRCRCGKRARTMPSGCYDASLEIEPAGAEPLQADDPRPGGLNRAPEALKRLMVIIAQYPKSAFPANIKGDVLLNEKRTAEAITAFRTAMDRDPGWWVPYRNLALAQIAGQRQRQCDRNLKSGIDTRIEPGRVAGGLGGNVRAQGSADDAIAVYEAALKKNPQSEWRPTTLQCCS